MKNYYAEAIQRYQDCASKNILSDLLLEVLKVSPNAIIKAHIALSKQPASQLDINVKSIALDEGKIPAIKYLRGETGIGLKEAKEYVEKLIGQR